jgi:hypothetical protein
MQSSFMENLKRSINPAEKGGRPKGIFGIASSLVLQK